MITIAQRNNKVPTDLLLFPPKRYEILVTNVAPLQKIAILRLTEPRPSYYINETYSSILLLTAAAAGSVTNNSDLKYIHIIMK